MDYCGPRGIPHSEFLSWPADDQAKALLWMAEDALRCSGCGTADWEWEDDPNAFVAQPYVCRGCARTETARKNLGEQVRSAPGMHVRLVRGGAAGGQEH